MELGSNVQACERQQVAQLDGRSICAIGCSLCRHESIEVIHAQVHDIAIEEEIVYTFIVPLTNIAPHRIDSFVIAVRRRWASGSYITRRGVLKLLVQKTQEFFSKVGRGHVLNVFPTHVNGCV
jgi:hypothetical protein